MVLMGGNQYVVNCTDPSRRTLVKKKISMRCQGKMEKYSPKNGYKGTGRRNTDFLGLGRAADEEALL